MRSITILLAGPEYYNEKGSSLKLQFLTWGLRIPLPRWLVPYDALYGVSLLDMGGGLDFLNFFYGTSSFDSHADKRWACYLPWMMWRHVSLAVEESDSVFLLKDYDGEEILATTHFETRRWTKGTGWFTWLRFFCPDMVRRTLQIDFDKEVGKDKGSYKGGILGTGIETLNDQETEESALQRYCDKSHLTLVKADRVSNWTGSGNHSDNRILPNGSRKLT